MSTFQSSKIMINMNENSKIIYSLNNEDVQNVAESELGRKLTENELKIVEDDIGDNIDWYEAIRLVIFDKILSK